MFSKTYIHFGWFNILHFCILHCRYCLLQLLHIIIDDNSLTNSKNSKFYFTNTYIHMFKPRKRK